MGLKTEDRAGARIGTGGGFIGGGKSRLGDGFRERHSLAARAS